jgi:hypothetical protein
VLIDVLESQREASGNAGLFHRDAVQHVCHRHRGLAVSDHDELRVLLEFTQDIHESPDVGVIQSCIDFVQNTERTGPTA